MESINYWAVLVAAVVSLVVGMIWYADPVFGKTWKRLQGMSGPVKPTASAFIVWAAASFVMAYTMYRIVLLRMAIQGLGEALLIGMLIAVGIVISGSAPAYVFAKKPLSLFAIEQGYVVLSILIMTAVVTVWR